MRTVTYKLPIISFSFGYKPHSVVSRNAGKLVIPGSSVRTLTSTVVRVVRSSALHRRVDLGTHGIIRECSRRKIVGG